MIGAKLSAAATKHIETVHNGYVINVIVASKSGNADLIACIRGKFFAFEIKGKGDTEKRLQDEKLTKVTKAGGYGGYVYSLADIDDIVNNLRQPKMSPKTIKISL